MESQSYLNLLVLGFSLWPWRKKTVVCIACREKFDKIIPNNSFMPVAFCHKEVPT